MKMRYYTIWYDDEKKTSTRFQSTSLEPLDPEWQARWDAEWKKEIPDHVVTSELSRIEALTQPYGRYLGNSIDEDLSGNYPEEVDFVLDYVAKLERGEVEGDTFFYHDFVHSLSRTAVTFEHAIFGECYEWPLWSCSLAEYKVALEGWRIFIALPPHIDNEMIVELPERPLHIEHNVIGPYICIVDAEQQ